MANAGLFPDPKFRAFDAAGAPLAGGKVYTYTAGTTTPKGSQVSRTGAANANPVILDANGEANIWLLSGTYKIKVDNSADVEQWVVDDVSAAGDLPQLWLATGSDAYFSAGNVYIGASSGGQTLTVVGTASVSSTLAVTGVTTLTAQPILSSLTASLPVSTDSSKGLISSTVTGTGTTVVLNASPTLTGTVTAPIINASGNVDALTLSTGNETFTYDEGTFTATYVGFTTSVTPTMSYARTGSMVTIYTNAVSATSNTTGMTCSGMPASIRPPAQGAQCLMAAVTDSGTETANCKVSIDSSGVMTFYLISGSNWTTNFTNTGTKGHQASSISYNIVSVI